MPTEESTGRMALTRAWRACSSVGHGGESQMRERTTEVDGLSIVLLHGASVGSSGDVFARNVGPLAAGGLRAIAPDRPGYGRSGGPDDPTLAGHCRFALGFLDALGLASAVIVGHS